MSHRIILDTDIGTDSDDAIALGLALASPELDLLAVTHVSGDTRTRAQISRRLLDLAGRSDVPVYAGCDVPRSRDYEFAWFGYEGQGIIDSGSPPQIANEDRTGAAVPPPRIRSVSDEHAVKAMIGLLRDNDDVELVAIGPLTNVASALIQAPDIAHRIKRLTIMGGYVRHVACGGGVIAPMVDYNLRIDAESTRIVLSSDIPMLLVPTDVTVQVWMTEPELRQLEQSDSALLQCIARNIRHWSPLQHKIFTHLGAHMQPDNVGFLHDPLALACVIDETFCTVEELPIELVTEDGILRTREREHRGPNTRQLRIATTVDAPRFQRFVHDRLTRFP